MNNASMYSGILVYLTLGMSSGNTDPDFPLTWAGVTKAMQMGPGFQGQLQIVDTLHVMAEVLDKYQSSYSSHPGVFVYEVAEPAGAWLATYIVMKCSMPSREEIDAAILPLCLDFFAKEEPDEFVCYWCSHSVQVNGTIGEDGNGCPHCGNPCIPSRLDELGEHCAFMDPSGRRWLTADHRGNILCLTPHPETGIHMFSPSHKPGGTEVYPYRGAHYDKLFGDTSHGN